MTFVFFLIWLVAIAAQLFLASLQISTEAQFFLSAVIILLLILLKQLQDVVFIKMIFIGLCSFIVMRYFVWRTMETIPPIDEPFAFVPGILLYAAELYAILMFFVSIFVVIDPLRREPSEAPFDPQTAPSVDVFVPTYNEEPDILAATLAAAVQMRYPPGKLRVYLLDDGGTEQKLNDTDRGKAQEAARRAEVLKELCASLGAHYLTRTRNVHAKAGNMNAAFERTSGDLIAIFDADHIPTSDFLERTVGYMQKDSNIFLVQTPHFFINPDPLERNLDTFSRMPSENEMFYGVIQRGLDRWNGSFFCGSAAVLRRKCLEEVGGFKGDTITEDAESALELHCRGYRSVYIDRPMISGLQPESFESFIGQRTRWCQGMIQIFLLKNPIFRRGLHFPQRLCYMSSNMFWFFGLVRLMFVIAPMFYVFFGLEVYRATAMEFFSYTLFYLMAAILMQSFLFGKTRWPLVSELYEYIQSFFSVPAILSVLLHPRKPSFKVTAKGETLAKDDFSSLARPFFLMTALLIAAEVITIWRWFALPDTREVLYIVAAWNTFSLLLSLGGLRIVCERKQIRKSPRVIINEPAALIAGDLPPIKAFVLDASIGGAKVLVPQGAITELQLRSMPVYLRTFGDEQWNTLDVRLKVRNVRPDREGLAIGASFNDSSGEAHKAISRLVFASSDRWVAFQSARQRNAPGVMAGLGFFLSICFGAAVAVFRILTRKMDGHEPDYDRAAVRTVESVRFDQHPMSKAA